MLETKLVKVKDHPDGVVMINASDFNPEIHEDADEVVRELPPLDAAPDSDPEPTKSKKK
jgi:hypothetical protein